MLDQNICPQENCRLILNEKNRQVKCQACFHKGLLQFQERKRVLQETKQKLMANINAIFEQESFVQHIESSTQHLLLVQKHIQIKQRLEEQAIQIQNFKMTAIQLQAYHQNRCDEFYRNQNLSSQMNKLLQVKQNKIQILRKKILNIKTTILCQLPILLDDSSVFKEFSIADEIEESQLTSRMNPNFIYTSYLEQSIIRFDKQAEEDLTLGLKKSPDKWNDYFQDNQIYYEILIGTIRKSFLLIYYMAVIHNIELPYPIVFDPEMPGYPQLQYKIFTYDNCMLQKIQKAINFQQSSLTHMQLNLYFIFRSLNYDMDRLINKHYNLMDLIDFSGNHFQVQDHELYYLFKPYHQKMHHQLHSSERKRAIPIRLVKSDSLKFTQSEESETEEDEDYVIIY